MKYLTPKFKNRLVLALNTIKVNHPSINFGGCGVFAKIIANQLTKRGFKVEFVILFRSKYAVGQANEHALNNNVDGIYNTNWCHILLKVNGQYIDSGGIHESEASFNSQCDWGEDFVIGDPIPMAVILEFLSNKHRNNWNSRFDRSKSGVIAMEFARNLV